MHRGVRELVRWVQENDGKGVVVAQKAAAASELSALEHQLGGPLPADLRLVLSLFNGAALPNGTLLSARPGPGPTIEAGLKEVAGQRGVSFLDPELLLPFHRALDASIYLCFDRSAAPVPDAWPVVDFDVESGDVRLIHRTFDGWCRLCVAEWTSADAADEFTIDKYLRQGERHAAIEPDVSVAHVTVGHALRRAGHPERALDSYLRAGRCVPAIPWADWEALKLASLLELAAEAVESAGRLAVRAPAAKWEQRGTTPSRVAFALGRVAPARPDERVTWLRLTDQLVAQALDDDDRAAAVGIRAALANGTALPAPSPLQAAPVAPSADQATWLAAIRAAYAAGELRDEDLLLDPALSVLGPKALADVLRIRRDF